MRKILFYAIALFGLAGATGFSPLLAQVEETEGWEQNRPRALTLIGKDFTLPAGQRAREVVVIRGSAIIEGTIERDLVVIGGNVELNGRVRGQMVIVGGSAKLGPQADVRRDAVVVGGDLTRDPGARIGGDVVEVLPNLGFPRVVRPILGWITNGLLLGRPMAPKVGWSWAATAILVAFYCLLALLFKRALHAGVETVETRPFGSFFAGFLVLLLVAPVTILLIASAVGIVLVPFLLCGLVFAFFLGKATVYQFVGFQLSSSLRASTALSLLALIIGAAIFLLLYLVPVLGFVMWGLVTIWGIGAVTLAAFRSFRRGKAESPATVTFSSPQATAGSANPPIISSAAAAVPGAQPAALSYALAGFWLRFFSMLLDFTLVGGLLALAQVQHLVPGLFLLIWFVYHIGFWIWKGTTIGDIIVGIKCIRTDGQPMNAATAVVRALSSVFSAMAFGLGFFWAGWDRQKQSWHDKIAGTYMVKVPKGASLI